MASDVTGPGRRLEMGRVAQATFGLAGRDFGINFAIAVALAIVPALLRLALTGGVAAQPAAFGRPGIFGPGFLIVAVLNLFLSLLAYGAIIAGALERLQGRAPSLRERLTPALRALPTLLGVGVLGYIGIVAGMILLIVPGVILALMWIVVFPVGVAETRNVFTCFSRSGALTKGHRWSIFLLLLAIWLGALILALLFGVIIFAALGLHGSPFFGAVGAAGPLAVVALLLQVLAGAAIRVVWGCGLAALYQELRALKGGFDAQRLGEVFS